MTGPCEVERPPRIEVRQAGKDDPADRAHDAEPQDLRQSADCGDAPVQQKHGEEADQDRERCSGGNDPLHLEVSRPRDVHGGRVMRVDGLEFRPIVGRISRKPDASGRDRQWRAEGNLPDKEE